MCAGYEGSQGVRGLCTGADGQALCLAVHSECTACLRSAVLKFRFKVHFLAAVEVHAGVVTVCCRSVGALNLWVCMFMEQSSILPHSGMQCG
jgi:hypothetical protein